jgi:hypothetical protein
MGMYMYQRKNDLIEELTEILKEQDPDNWGEIYDLVVEMIKEHKHF